MNWRKNNSVLLPLGIILLLGSILRFYHFTFWSLNKEELDVVLRSAHFQPHDWLGYGDAVTGNTLGLNFILFAWMKLFGNSPAIVRLPFVLTGIASIYLFYVLIKHWFGNIAAMFSALTISVSGFFILHSQLVSADGPSLLLMLAVLIIWTQIAFPTEDSGTEKRSFFILALLIGIGLNLHYYFFVFAGVLLVSGLLFLDRKKIITYLLAFVGSLILFIPHLPFTKAQLTTSIISWLPMSGSSRIMNRPEEIFNSSDFFIWPVTIIFAGSLIFFYNSWRFTRFHFLTLTFLIVPFVCTYLFGPNNHIEFHYPYLIFAAPFLFIFLFSYFPKTLQLDTKLIALAFIMSTGGLLGLMTPQNFYQQQRFGLFRDLAEHSVTWSRIYHSDQITSAYNIDNKQYLDYYLKGSGSSLNPLEYSVNSGEELGHLSMLVNTASTRYFMYGWSSVDNLPEAAQVIMTSYPYLRESRNYFQSGIYLYSKDSIDAFPGEKAYFSMMNDFENSGKWDYDSIMQSSIVAKSGKYSILMTEKNEFSPTFVNHINRIKPPGDHSVLVASAWVYLPDTASDAEFVVTFESLNSVYTWHSQKLNHFVHKPGTWTKVIVARRIPKLPSDEDIVKVYMWNPKKKKIFIDDMKIEMFNGE